MKATLALVLLLTPAGAAAQPTGAAAQPTGAAAQPTSAAARPSMPCQVFVRSNTEAPQLVRAWLARSSDERVAVCAQPPPATADAVPTYAGEGPVTRRGAVCSYPSHGLMIEGNGAAERLRRYENGEATAMALAGHDCPTPHPAGAPQPYTTTYDVSSAAFVSIMELWSTVTASSAAFERELSCCGLAGPSPGAAPRALGPSDAQQRLRAAIVAGDMKAAVVTRIVRIPDSAFHRRYALFVLDPSKEAAGSRFYVLYLRRGLRGPSHLIGIAETD
jgi:hypothetical protein